MVFQINMLIKRKTPYKFLNGLYYKLLRYSLNNCKI